MYRGFIGVTNTLSGPRAVYAQGDRTLRLDLGAAYKRYRRDLVAMRRNFASNDVTQPEAAREIMRTLVREERSHRKAGARPR